MDTLNGLVVCEACRGMRDAPPFRCRICGHVMEPHSASVYERLRVRVAPGALTGPGLHPARRRN